MKNWLQVLTLALCRLMLKGYPLSFRRQAGQETLRDSKKLLQEQRFRGGVAAFAAFCSALLADTLAQLLVQRRPRRRREILISAQPLERGRRTPGGIMQSLWFDLRIAMRSLLRRPGFSLVAVLTLALALGANTTLFSLVHAVLLKPLPYPQPEQLVALWDSAEFEDKFRVSPFNFAFWRDNASSFHFVGLFGSAGHTLQTDQGPVLFYGSRVSLEFFDVLGVEAQRGRLFSQDDFAGQGLSVVINTVAWKAYLGDDERPVGKVIALDGQPYEVIGVVADQLYPLNAWASGRLEFGSDQPRFWRPAVNLSTHNHAHAYGVLARLKEGVDLAQAREELQGLDASLRQEYPETHATHQTRLVTLTEEAVGSIDQILWMLFGAVGCVLLIACVNVANLILVRIHSRRSEMALRQALGAGKVEMLRQFLAEGLLLGAAGAVVGTLAAVWAIGLLPSLAPAEVPRLQEAALNLPTLALTLGLCLITAAVFACIPLWRSRRAYPADTLRPGGRSTESASGHRLRGLLVAAETALAVMLVIGAGLFLRSLQQLRSVDPGFKAGEVLVVEMHHSPHQFDTPQSLRGFYSQLLEEVRALPAVDSAAASYDHPMESNWFQGFGLKGYPDLPSGESRTALYRTVTRQFFHTMGVPLIEGRLFDGSEGPESANTVIVNRAFARRWFGEDSPLGKTLVLYTMEGRGEFEVIGVVGDVRFSGPRQPSEPAYYLSFQQTPQHKMNLLVRTQGPARRLLPQVRAKIESLQPAQAIATASTIEEILSASVADSHFSTLVLGFFALSALGLALVGLWGVCSDLVNARQREIGLRMALGAERWNVFRHMTRRGMAPAAAGALIGLAGAAALSRWIGEMLFQISPLDGRTYLLVPLLLLSAAFLAAALPALRASRTDPLQVLRRQQ
ncbi:MAG TPA: ABC transporter permease [Acidobacteriota bacterium]|nr:ABC transporter permease [Acidobacteriota bacterium]